MNAAYSVRLSRLFQSLCAMSTKSLPSTHKLHAHSITSGLLSSHNGTHFTSLLLSAYCLCGHILYACKLFDKLPKRTLVSYKPMIRMYVENGRPRSALELFVETHQSGCSMDEYVFPFVVRACGDLGLIEFGVMTQGLIVRSGLLFSTFVGNSLLAMYMNCGDVEGARVVFDVMEEKTVVSWNTMISGNLRNDKAEEALIVFSRMMESMVEIDSATVLSVLPACGYLKDLKVGREVHSLIEEKGFGKRVPVQNALVDMYARCGRIDEAHGVFDKLTEKDVVSWTTMIHGYILNGEVRGALDMFRLMQFEGAKPNEVTLVSLLAMCTEFLDMKLGKCLHGWAIRQHTECDVIVETALIDLYSKCGLVEHSFRVFSRTSKKRTVPWNAILSGCIHNELAREAIGIFKKMLLEAVKLNDATWKSLLPAYAIEADLYQALNIHGFLFASGFIKKVDIVTGLVDVYSKCGNLEYAHKIFDGVSTRNRDIVLWSAIISGYGKHGHGEVVVSLFDQMVQFGVKPNEITFTSVLHACGHAGMVDHGLNLFKFMQNNHPECLRSDHYTCMVDLLGRANQLLEAYELIKTMPFKPNHAVWGALLGACVIHENVELGEVAANWLFELEPENTGNYVLMGNIYSAVGRFGDAEKVRTKMDNIGLIKAPAQSVVEARNL